MNIPSISDYSSPSHTSQPTSASTNTKNVEQSFLDYMKESPMQRMIDAWLKAHNLSEQALQ